MARPSKRRFELEIRQINYIKKLLEIDKIEDVDKAAMKRLKNNLKKIKDVRVKGKTKFKIWDIIICSILAILFGAQDWEDIRDFVDDHYDWLREFLFGFGIWRSSGTVLFKNFIVEPPIEEPVNFEGSIEGVSYFIGKASSKSPVTVISSKS